MVGRKNIFQNGASQMVGKHYFDISLFHKGAMLLIFYAEYTESVLDSLLYPESTMGPPWLAQGKIFKLKALRRLENAILRLAFANTVNLPLFRHSFNCFPSIMLPSHLQIGPDFEDVMTQFCLNFLKFQKLGCYTPYLCSLNP